MKSARILLMTLMSLIFSVGVVRVCWSAVDRGAIQGTVTDAQGAVVPNVLPPIVTERPKGDPVIW